MLFFMLLCAAAGTSFQCTTDVERCLDARAPSGTACCENTIEAPGQFANCGGSRPVGLPFATRSPVYAREGMAATSQPLSTQVALDILKAGGSAVDAAIAANAMEGVVEPMMNGMGGDIMTILFDPASNKLHGYNGAGRSSSSFSYDQMKERLAGKQYIPMKGPLPVSVPGAVKGWCDLHDKFGKLPLSAVLAPAIKYASDGFPVSEVIASEWELTKVDSDVTSGGKYPHAADGFFETFTVDGKHAPRAGQIFSNKDLARSLQKVADHGCSDFYNGSIAAAIEAFSTVAGTTITKEDMAAHHGAWVDPVNVTYRNRYRIFELPPNPQGIAALQQLNILEGYDLKSMGHNSADYLHVHVESKKLAFADRAKYYADPDFVNVPVEGLLSKTYAAERRKLINMERAADTVDAGTPVEHEWPRSGDTIYLTVADSAGMMVSLIQSNFNGFGSGLVVPGLGFALQDRGALFSMQKGAADVYVAGKRPFHTIIPGFAFKDEMPWLSFGVMGGNMQPQGHAQVLCNIIDFGMNVQEAGDAARYQHAGSSQPTGQVMTDGGVVILEAGVCSDVRYELTRRGHDLQRGANGGGYQAIMRQDDGGSLVYHGASEMRKDGHAGGY